MFSSFIFFGSSTQGTLPAIPSKTPTPVLYGVSMVTSCLSNYIDSTPLVCPPVTFVGPSYFNFGVARLSTFYS